MYYIYFQNNEENYKKLQVILDCSKNTKNLAVI